MHNEGLGRGIKGFVFSPRYARFSLVISSTKLRSFTAQENGCDPCDGILLSWPPSIEECRRHKKIQYTVTLQSLSNELTFWRPPYGPGVLLALGLIDIQFGYYSGFDWEQFAELASGILVRPIILTVIDVVFPPDLSLNFPGQRYLSRTDGNKCYTEVAN